MNFKPIAIDTETTGTRPFQGDRATVVSFADEHTAWALPASDARPELDRILASGRPVVMHNSAFDRAVLSTSFGIEFPDHRIRDTMIYDWLLREAHPHGLKEIGARLFGADAKAEQAALKALMRGPTLDEIAADLFATGDYKTKKAAREAAPHDPRYVKRGWADLTFAELEPYAIQDARLTYDVFKHLTAEVATTQPDVKPALPREHKVAGLMYRLNKTGIRVNQSAAEQALLQAQAQAEALKAQIPCEPDSPAQVGKWLFEDLGLPPTRKTPKGSPSTDKIALEALRWHEDVARLLEYRQVTKSISAYLLPLLDRLGSDGRVHPSFNAHRVVTGRLSCSEPNLMTIPREGTNSAVRALFEPEPGMVFVAADLPQAELRVAASLANEALWLESFKRGDDLHQTMADAMGVDRYVAKTANFALLYGAGPFKLAETLARGTGKAPNVYGAKQAVARYWQAAPNIRRLMDQMASDWASQGYLELPASGRYRHRQGPYGPEPEHKALNSVVQGGVAELVKAWMVELQPELDALGARLVLQVHDSLVIECEPHVAEKVGYQLQQVLDDVNPYAGIAFPLDIKAGM